MHKCSMCGGNLEEKSVNHIVDFENFIIIIKKVPANVCRQCGEYYLDHKVAGEVEKIIDNYKDDAAEVVIVNYYDLVA